MDTREIADLNPVTLAAVAKLVEKEAKKYRDALEPGEYTVDTVVTLVLGAEVKVLADQEGVLTPQKAKPWGLVHVLLEELSKAREAAGLAGIDLAKVVAMALKVDKDLAKKAEAAANEETASLKEPTRQSRKGSVLVKGEVGLPA